MDTWHSQGQQNWPGFNKKVKKINLADRISAPITVMVSAQKGVNKISISNVIT